jgi:hypothetical protein
MSPLLAHEIGRLMASSPSLVKAMVEAIGEDRASVQVTLRRLRDWGLIPVGARGRYSVNLDYISAMRLLLGICASVPLEKDAAKEAVYSFERLVGGLNESETVASEGWDPATIKFPLDQLGEEHMLGDALVTLLRAGATDALYVFLDEKGVQNSEYKDSWLRGYLRVAFYLPIPLVRIEHQIGGLRKVWRYGFLGGAPLESYISVLREQHLGGRMHVTEIDGTSFEIIGQAVADER